MFNSTTQTDLIPELIKNHFDKTGKTPRVRKEFTFPLISPRVERLGTVSNFNNDAFNQRRLEL